MHLCAAANNACIDHLSESGYPLSADTLCTEVLPVLGFRTENRRRYYEYIFSCLPILWYHICTSKFYKLTRGRSPLLSL